MTEQRTPHSDLDALLRKMPPEEADRLREVWDLAGDEEPVEFRDAIATEEALQQMRAVVERDESKRAQQQRPAGGADPAAHRHARGPQRPASQHWERQNRRRWHSATALLVALFIGAVGFYWWHRPVTRTAPLGERLVLTLPDSSHVELNSGSSIRYGWRFGKNRTVRLDGEAFFDVAEEARPFVVRTFNAEIQVLGTRFNVRAWPDDQERSTRVTLVKGRVTLSSNRHPDRAVTLAPGETRRVDADVTQVDPLTTLDVTVEEATAWRRGDLIFKDLPLGMLLQEIERRFAVNLSVHPSSLQHQRINLALRQPANAETVIRDLARALDLRYRERSNGYELYKQAPY